MATSDPKKNGVKTTETIFRIIEALRELDGATVSEVSTHLDMSRSWTYCHLDTLEELEYVVNEGGTYRLGLKFLDQGRYVKSKYEVCDIIQPSLDYLAEETGEAVRFSVEEHGRARQLIEAAGERAVTIDQWVGQQTHMHYFSAGKAMLAFMPESKVHEIIDRHGLPAQSDHTIVDEDELFEELARIRERGVAFNEEENNIGIRAVGAPILYGDEVVGAISIFGPANRLTGTRFRETIPQKLKATTNEIELKLFKARSRSN